MAATFHDEYDDEGTAGVNSRLPTLCCKRLAEKPEPRGFIYVSAARGSVVIFGALFASVAINEFARALSDCDGKVLNGTVKASSVLASLGTIEGVLNAILSPFMGAFADLTPYRKTGLFLAFLTFTSLVVVQGVMFIPRNTDVPDPRDDCNIIPNNCTAPGDFLQEPLWATDAALVFLVISVVVQVVAYEIAALLTVSYTAELSSDKTELTGYVSMGYTVLNGMQLLVAVLITGSSLAFGFSSLQQGVVGSAIVFVFTLMWFVPGFPMLGKRRPIAEGADRSCCGLNHLRTALKDIIKDYSELLKLLCSWSLASASLSSITILATSYLQFQLGYKGTQVSLLLSLALFFSVPGSLLTKYLVRRFSLRAVYIGILAGFGVSFILAPLVLVSKPEELGGGGDLTLTRYGKCNRTITLEDSTTSAETENVALGYVIYLTAIFTAFWGLGIGSAYVSNNALYATLIPGGRESSFFGIKVTFAKLFTWVPPLCFTLINEKTDLLQYAILVLAPFFLAGACVAYFIDEEKGHEQVSSTLHLRQGKYNADAHVTAKVEDEVL